MKLRVRDPNPSRARTLNIVFISAICVIALAVMLVIGHSIDSVQQTTTAVHETKIKEIPVASMPPPDMTVSEALKKQDRDSDARILMKQRDSQVLEGSELVFEAGVKASEQGEFRESMKLFSKVLTLIPGEAKSKKVWIARGVPCDRNLYTAFAYQLRSFCFLQQKQYREGINDLDTAIRLRPDYTVNYQNRAAAYTLIGERNLAAADLQTVRRLEVLDRQKDK